MQKKSVLEILKKYIYKKNLFFINILKQFYKIYIKIFKKYIQLNKFKQYWKKKSKIYEISCNSCLFV